jgi:hypothetical protein
MNDAVRADVLREIKLVITKIQNQQEERGRGDATWYYSAMRAKESAIAKRNVIIQMISNCNTTSTINLRKMRVKQLHAAKTELEAGKIGPALASVINMMIDMWSGDRAT